MTENDSDGTCEFVGIDESGGMNPCDRSGRRDRHGGLMYSFCDEHWTEVRGTDQVATSLPRLRQRRLQRLGVPSRILNVLGAFGVVRS